MSTADTRRVLERVEATVASYMDWVSAQPRLARFMYKARAAVAAGPSHDELSARNKNRHRVLLRGSRKASSAARSACCRARPTWRF